MSLFCHLSLSSTHYLDTASSTISDKYLNWKWHHLLPFPTQHCMGCFFVIHLKSVSESLPEFHSLQAMKRKYSINLKLEFWTQQMVFSLVMYSAGGASCLVAPPIPVAVPVPNPFSPNLNTLSATALEKSPTNSFSDTRILPNPVLPSFFWPGHIVRAQF